MEPIGLYISRAKQRGFITRALPSFNKDLEYMECFSFEKRPEGFFLKKFYKIDFEVQKSDTIVFDDKQLKALKDKIKKQGYWFGTIHTHPGYKDAIPSHQDWISAVYNNEDLAGICGIWKDAKDKIHHVVNYWIPALPCKKIYL